jgi:hypothetical protein
VGDLDVGDFAWTEGNQYNPYGTAVAVVKIGSEYSGQFAQIVSKLDKGFGPQLITVQRYQSRSHP